MNFRVVHLGEQRDDDKVRVVQNVLCKWPATSIEVYESLKWVVC